MGVGTGESLVLSLTSEKVPRPAKLTGITSRTDHFLRASMRVMSIQGSVQVRTCVGDAVWRRDNAVSQTGHPLDPDRSQHTFDTVLALDCAYHFDTRIEFLRQSFQALKPGGRIALADNCFSISSNSWLAYLAPVPRENVVTKEGYSEQLLEIGYENVELEDITEYVFPGFTRFLRRRGACWTVFSVLFLLFVRLVGLRFVVVSAQRPRLH